MMLQVLDIDIIKLCINIISHFKPGKLSGGLCQLYMKHSDMDTFERKQYQRSNASK